VVSRLIGVGLVVRFGLCQGTGQGIRRRGLGRLPGGKRRRLRLRKSVLGSRQGSGGALPRIDRRLSSINSRLGRVQGRRVRIGGSGQGALVGGVGAIHGGVVGRIGVRQCRFVGVLRRFLRGIGLGDRGIIGGGERGVGRIRRSLIIG